MEEENEREVLVVSPKIQHATYGCEVEKFASLRFFVDGLLVLQYCLLFYHTVLPWTGKYTGTKNIKPFPPKPPLLNLPHCKIGGS